MFIFFVIFLLTSCNSSKVQCQDCAYKKEEKLKKPLEQQGLITAQQLKDTERFKGKTIEDLILLLEENPKDLKVRNLLSYEYFQKGDFKGSWLHLHISYLIDPTDFGTTFNMIAFASCLNDSLKLVEKQVRYNEVWQLIGTPSNVGSHSKEFGMVVHEYDEVQFVYYENKLVAILAKESSPAYHHYSQLSKTQESYHIDENSL